MRDVNVSELQDHLGEYLTFAKAGESIVIRDQDVPVAWLVPFVEDRYDEENRRLAAKGILRLPTRPMDIEEIFKMPMPKVEGNALTQALLDEREEGR